MLINFTYSIKMPKAKDQAWSHCMPIEGNKNGFTCNYCKREFLGGGVTRFKYHVAGIGDKDINKCKNAPPEVRRLFRSWIKEKEQSKVDKAEAHQKYLDVMNHVDVSDSDEEDDIYNQAIRRAQQESRESEWNYEQSRGADFERSQRESGQGSKPKTRGKLTGFFSRSNSMRQSKSRNLDGDLFRKPDSRQPTIKVAMQKGFENFKTTYCKWLYTTNINPHQALETPLAQEVVDQAARYGLGVKVPTPYEVYGPFLDRQYENVMETINQERYKWSQYGVTIMCDGWTGPTRRSLMNFMIYCDGECTFYKSYDVSGDFKDYKNIMKYMKKVVEWVGKENVVQIVTDNGPNYKKARERLAKMPGNNFVWTGCAAHSIDLILKEFCRRPSVFKVIEQARHITKWVYNHTQETTLMRKHCGGDLVRPALTHFATNFLALQSMHNKKVGLKAMIVDSEWVEISTRKKDVKMYRVEDLINDRGFWDNVKCIVDCLEPLVETLRLVDGDRKPTMGFLHRWMEMVHMKVGASRRYPRVLLEIIERRWTKQLSHDLHKAGKSVANYFIFQLNILIKLKLYLVYFSLLP